MEAEEYKLSCELNGHEEDVRGICICGENAFATGSRDKTVRLWSLKDEERNSWVLEKTLVGHTSFVGPVAWIPSNDKLPKGGLVSGGMDTNIIVWSLESSQPVEVLRGHELQVTCVILDEQGDILSASVDSTVRRWRKGQTIEILKGHQGPVQTVLKLPSGDIVTGSSDTTLKVWRGANCIQTLSGHSDTVRGLANFQNIGLLSASHDGSVRLWALSGEPLLEMVGHTSIVYCVTASTSGYIASGGEDCFVKLWRDGMCCQSIEHPGCIWDVKFLPNGDIVTACSDGVARIWTRDQKRFALQEVVDAYLANIAARKSQMKTVGGVNVRDLPGIEALTEPGRKDGQTKIIREGDNGVAYSWNAKDYKWDKVGELVDGPEGLPDKQTINGVHYDYVFDVDIGDGQPTRKLPYNRGDNPYFVADNWLLREDLPLSYREQIVEFILKNTGQACPTIDSSFVDPYTRASAYVPQQQQPSASRTELSTSNKDVGGVGSQSHSYKHIPKKGMLLFDIAQYDGIVKKMGMFSSSLTSDEGTKNLALDEEGLSSLHAIISVLKDTSHYHTSSFSDVDFQLLTKWLLHWPHSMLFPVLDILRMILLHPQGASQIAKDIKNGKDVLMEALRRAAAAPTIDANNLTGIRVAVNCFRHAVLRSWILQNRNEIVDLFSEGSHSSNKNVRLSYATLLLNYSVILRDTEDEGQIQILSAALEMVGPDEQDLTTRFRALVAVGSLVFNEAIRKMAAELDIETIARVAKMSSDSQISEVGDDIVKLLFST